MVKKTKEIQYDFYCPIIQQTKTKTLFELLMNAEYTDIKETLQQIGKKDPERFIRISGAVHGILYKDLRTKALRRKK